MKQLRITSQTGWLLSCLPRHFVDSGHHGACPLFPDSCPRKLNTPLGALPLVLLAVRGWGGSGEVMDVDGVDGLDVDGPLGLGKLRGEGELQGPVEHEGAGLLLSTVNGGDNGGVQQTGGI